MRTAVYSRDPGYLPLFYHNLFTKSNRFPLPDIDAPPAKPGRFAGIFSAGSGGIV
jgi:hypothetical protein